MDIKSHAHGAVAVLELSGRFDANSMPQVKKEIERLAAANLVVNLSGVHFIDSAGLSALIGAMKRCRQSGGDLHLSNLQQPVQIIFELTKLQRAFETFDSETAAISAFSA